MAFATFLARRLQGLLLQQRAEIGNGGFLKDREPQDGSKTTLTRRVALVHNIHPSIVFGFVVCTCHFYLLAGQGFIGKQIPRMTGMPLVHLMCCRLMDMPLRRHGVPA
ncbi:uncharacterized protein BDZ99DRAFT_294215 [Mytilinidion resinicola]|uniref:Uncharacterized protein n=1 Tax=Mytilinidion resinicola TaxID=574789 RepID=A0A6A6YQJ1_9PEZI|nr:uncharacterized protein BDZ99DRAFT_294215 [Mytilinidion resinicola]KAF2811050.1 hypothetical protein BDZ99DRAFT_294215 [Mytilinidion resinicola]